MKFREFIQDYLLWIVSAVIVGVFLVLFALAFKCPMPFILLLSITWILFPTIFLLSQYHKKRVFFFFLRQNLEQLDHKYLLSELVPEAYFLDAKIFKEVLWEITKSYQEEINQYKYSVEDFKEYVELWIHEVKVPIASSLLIIHNHKNKDPQKIVEQIGRIENYVEQILYYVRSENAEKDYLIKPCNPRDVVNKVIVKNKERFIYDKIKLEIEPFEQEVLTDSKWLEFILSQIFQNSMKYRREEAKIKVSFLWQDNEVQLKIWDNGIGISKSDLPRVFDKSFTGQNGRKVTTSTGMGLYIAKKLCQKLGHKIEIASKENTFTEVTITFYQNEFYDVVR